MRILDLKKIAYSLGIWTVANTFSSIPAWAQNFTVAPMVTISEARGGQAKGSIILSNNGKEPLRMRVYAEDFTYDLKKGFVSMGKHERSAVPYLQFSPRELVIPPGVTRSVRVSTTLLPSLPNGEYRAVIFLEDLKERTVKSDNTNAVIIKSRVASVFYISKGTNSSDLQLNTAAWDNTAKKLSFILTNKGRQSAFPDVNWRMTKDGKEVAKDRLRGILVQSENEREVALSSNGKDISLASGSYVLAGEIIVPSKKAIPFSIKVAIP